MEDIVAIRIKLSSGESRYLLTWGRIPEVIDAEPLLSLVRDKLDRFDLGGTPKVVELCPTLQDASEAPYFFEALFKMSQRPIPFGSGYKAWSKRTLVSLKNGQELYYLGRRRWKGNHLGRLNVERSVATSKRPRKKPAP